MPPGSDTPRYGAFAQLFAGHQMPMADVVTTSSRAIMRAVIAGSDRLTLLSDSFALMQAGRLPVASYFALLWRPPICYR